MDAPTAVVDALTADADDPTASMGAAGGDLKPLVTKLQLGHERDFPPYQTRATSTDGGPCAVFPPRPTPNRRNR